MNDRDNEVAAVGGCLVGSLIVVAMAAGPFVLGVVALKLMGCIE